MTATTRTTGKRRYFLVVMTLVLIAAACSEEVTPTTTTEAPDVTEAPTTTAAAELREITVGSIPIVLLAPLVHAENEGWFAEEGLTISLETGAASGAANLTQVLAGDFEIGLSDVPSVMLAIASGLDVVAIAPVNAGGQTPEETYSAVGVGPESDISSPEDLAGATIATNELNNVSDITIKAALESRGIDSSTVTFVVVPLPEIPAAIIEGRVDAGLLLEPFLGAGLAQGVVPVLFNYVETVPVGTIAVYLVSSEFAQENPDVVESFRRVMARANAFVAENPDLVRDLVPTFTPVPEEAAARMRLPVFDPDQIGPEAIESLNGFMVDLGLLDEPVSPERVCPGCWD